MVLYRDRSSHGTNMTSTSAQGLSVNRTKFEPLLPGFIKLGAPYCYRCAWSQTYGECKLECARAVDQEIAFYGAENVGTMLGETVIGTGGVIPPPPEYWPMVCEICKANACWSSTTRSSPASAAAAPGSPASSSAPSPTSVTMAKGLSSGYLPLGAVGARDHVYEAFLGGRTRSLHEWRHLRRAPALLGRRAGQPGDHRARAPGRALRRGRPVARVQEGLKTLLAHPDCGRRARCGPRGGHRIRAEQGNGAGSGSRRAWARRPRSATRPSRAGVFVRLLGGGHCPRHRAAVHHHPPSRSTPSSGVSTNPSPPWRTELGY